jgi:hypothetical protein
MAKNKKLIALYRLFFGVLGLSAVATEIAVLLQRGTFMPANFFSFFTIQSNILASVILLVGAALLIMGKPPLGVMWRGAATLYMAVTGIIFALLLSGLDAGVLTAVPWDNTVLHYIMPIAVFGDWLIDRPKQQIRFKQALVWLIYPIAYLAYSLIRGHFVGWYPYPFLDASEKGYTAVGIVSIVVALVVMGIALIITRFGRHK